MSETSSSSPSSSSSSSSSSSVSCGAERYISLRKRVSDTYVDGRTQGYLLQLSVNEACHVDDAIFVFLRTVDTDDEIQDQFTNIASPYELVNLPVGEPNPGEQAFRMDAVDMVFRSLELLNQAFTDIVSDVQELISTLNKLYTHAPGDTVNIQEDSFAVREETICLEG